MFAPEKSVETTDATKMKTGSSSSDSSDSSDSEDSDNGEMNLYLLFYSLSSQWFLIISLPFPLPGLVPKEQKKTPSNKDTKRPPQPLVSVAGPPQPQLEPQPVQSKPSFVPAPPVSVPSLDSSHLLNSGFDPLVQFMNPHLTQSNSEPNPTISTASAPAAPGLLSVNEPTGHLPSDTHPFLNQHPIIPSPGRYLSPLPVFKDARIQMLFNSLSSSSSFVLWLTAMHSALPQQPPRPSIRAAPLPLKPTQPPPSSLAPLPTSASPQPMPHPRVPSSPSHAILGTLSAQPPQALLEDDEEPMPNSSEIQPFSQVHTLLQSLQPRPSVQPPLPQLQPLHMHAHSPAQVPSQLLSSVHMQAVSMPAPPPAQRHSSDHGNVRQPFPHSHTLAPQQQKSMVLQTKAAAPPPQQQQPSPRSKPEAIPTGGTPASPSGVVGFT